MGTPSSVTSPHRKYCAPSSGDASAYLIVHAEPDDHRLAARSPWQRLRAWCRAMSNQPRAALALTLSDRHGLTVLSLPDAEPVLGVALVPGTYHLTAVRGGSRRGYTVSLPAGSRFDLYLHFSLPERPTRVAAASPSRTGQSVQSAEA